MTDGCPSLYPDLTEFNYTHGNSTGYTRPTRVGTARSVSAPVASNAASQRIESNYQRRPSDSALNTPLHGQHDEPPKGRSPKRRKVSRPTNAACPRLIPKSRHEYPMGTLERVFARMNEPLETKRHKVRDSISAASKNDTKNLTEVTTNGGVVYCFVIQGDSAAAEEIIKIGTTTRPIKERQQELESCFPQQHRLIHESSYRKSVHFERLERLIFDSLDSHRNYFTCVRCSETKRRPATHDEYFKVSSDQALRIIYRLRTWLDTQPYEASGILSPIWRSRLIEVRALLPTQHNDSVNIDTDAILEFVTRPFTMSQYIALKIRTLLFSPANAGRLRFSRFQKVKSRMKGLPIQTMVFLATLLVSCFRIWPLYTGLFIVLAISLGAMLWWVKYEYEREVLKLIEGA